MVGYLRAPWGAALLVATIAATASAQTSYRGMPADALLRAAERAPQQDRPAILEALLDNRGAAASVLRPEARSGRREAKLTAITLLSEMRDGGAVPALLDAAADPDERVQRNALAALRNIGDPRAAQRFRQLVLQGGRGGALKIAAAGLGKIGKASDQPLLRGLLSSPDESVRVTAAGALAMQGSAEGQQALLDAIDGDNPVAQKNATYALGFLQTPEARARVQAILADPRERWKSYALIAEAQQNRAAQSPDEELATLTLLGRGRDRVAADWAIDELTDLAHPDATEVLRELSTRDDLLGTKARLRTRVREGR